MSAVPTYCPHHNNLPHDHNGPLENVVIIDQSSAETIDGILLQVCSSARGM